MPAPAPEWGSARPSPPRTGAESSGSTTMGRLRRAAAPIPPARAAARPGAVPALRAKRCGRPCPGSGSPRPEGRPPRASGCRRAHQSATRYAAPLVGPMNSAWLRCSSRVARNSSAAPTHPVHPVERGVVHVGRHQTVPQAAQHPSAPRVRLAEDHAAMRVHSDYRQLGVEEPQMRRDAAHRPAGAHGAHQTVDGPAACTSCSAQGA